MKTVEKWIWKIRWAGRWTTTLVPFTEDQVRREHPEAVRVEGSRVLVDVPETEAESQERQQQRAPRREIGPDGKIKKMWH
jgi:hypothetical protein